MASYPKIKVVIADDHDIYRDGLQMLLNREPDIEVIGEAAEGKKLIERVLFLKPDVVVTDLKMPEIDGIEAIRQIFQSEAHAKCIAVSTYDDDELIVDALEAGAMGYIIKNADKGEMIEAVRTVKAGNPYYCRSTSLRLARKISESNFNPYTKENSALFTPREEEIIRLICQEKTSEEIGQLLYMSPRTVERLRSKILEKMNVKTAIGVVIFAIKNRIYTIDR